MFFAQREEQEYFMRLEEQLCVIYARMKIVRISVSQNLANKRIMQQHPLRLIFILVYIYNSPSHFICCFISICNCIPCYRE